MNTNASEFKPGTTSDQSAAASSSNQTFNQMPMPSKSDIAEPQKQNSFGNNKRGGRKGNRGGNGGRNQNKDSQAEDVSHLFSFKFKEEVNLNADYSNQGRNRRKANYSHQPQFTKE